MTDPRRTGLALGVIMGLTRGVALLSGLAGLAGLGVLGPQASAALGAPWNRALVFLAVGVSLWLLENGGGAWRRLLGQLAGFVAVGGGVVSVAAVFQGALPGLGGVQRLPDELAPWLAGLARGAFVCPLLGAALMLMHQRISSVPARLVAGFALWFAALETLASLHAVEEWALATVAQSLPTSVMHLLVSLAVLLAGGRQGAGRVLVSRGSGGRVARRLLPATLVASLVLGAIVIEGLRRGVLAQELAVAALLTTAAVLAAGVVLWRGHQLDSEEAARGRAEEALRASEERFRALVEHGSDAIVLFSAEATTLYQSPSSSRILGYAPGERLGKSGFELVHPDDLAEVKRRFEKCLARPGETHAAAMRLLRKDGGSVDVEALATNYLHVPAVGAVVVNYRDVTERRRADEALRATERRYQTLVENSSDGIALLDAAGRLQYLSPVGARLLGREAGDLIGKSQLDYVAPPERPAVASVFAEAVANPGVPVRTEFRTQRPDGSWTLLEGALVGRLDDPAVAGVVSNFRDVTQRKRLEEELRQSQKLQAVGQLAGGIAHDFNNLLGVILGRAEMLERRLTAALPAELRHASEIRIASERAAALTRQLLAFSRKQVLAPELLDVNAVVTELEPMLRRLIGEDVELEMAAAPGLSLVKVDRGQLEQVLMNLAVNARDAMPGGGKLLVETAEVELDEPYQRAHPEARVGRQVLLAVSDTGTGIDAATLPRIFEPFFTTKEMGKGTGLGLSTVHGIVNQSGGHISVYSVPGAGSTFKVYLPISQESTPPALAASVAVRGSETILVLEDEPRLRKLILETLSEAGYRALIASTPEEALALAAGETPRIDLLLTDVVMPGTTGQALAERLAAERPGMRVLFMSGYTAAAIVRHGVLEKGLAFLPKPFTRATLLRRVRALLDDGGGGSEPAPRVV